MIKEIYEGLGVLLKYAPEGWCSAEHDEITADGPKAEQLDPADAARLDSLGWHYDGSYSCWAHFV